MLISLVCWVHICEDCRGPSYAKIDEPEREETYIRRKAHFTMLIRLELQSTIAAKYSRLYLGWQIMKQAKTASMAQTGATRHWSRVPAPTCTAKIATILAASAITLPMYSYVCFLP